jgi:hypothetical protein
LLRRNPENVSAVIFSFSVGFGFPSLEREKEGGRGMVVREGLV